MTPTPSLVLAHTTLAVRDLEAMVAFYVDVLGFHVTDRGAPAPGLDDMVFLSQDPAAHHQIVLVRDDDARPASFVLADHLAFRTATLGQLRQVGRRLDAAQVEGVIPICHGNAWSLYFPDPEGNGLEVFVDTPFHVAQPFADPLDLSMTDDELLADLEAKVADRDGSQPFADWRTAFAARLATDGEA
ncbi:MAG: VOC family protein [Acidimicrobiales bacterium]